MMKKTLLASTFIVLTTLSVSAQTGIKKQKQTMPKNFAAKIAAEKNQLKTPISALSEETPSLFGAGATNKITHKQF